MARVALRKTHGLPAPLDTLVEAETPEGIVLALRPAGVAPRLFAFLIDLAIRGGVLYLAALLASYGGGIGAAFLLLLWFALEWFYPVVFELGLEGATPGKRVMGLRVIMDDGLPVTPAASLTRNLLRTADFLPFLYGFALASMLSRPDFKRLGDLAARTLVVHNPGAAQRPAFENVEPVRPPDHLTARQRAALLAFAGRAAGLTPQRAAEVAALTGIAPQGDDDARVRHLLGVARWLLGARPIR